MLALGCPDRTLTKLAQEIDPLLADTAALLPGQPQGLSAAEITQLRARAPEFRAMCHELAQYAIPPSLEHGDLWGVNVIASEDSVTFIDWDEPCLAYPFFSLLELTLSVDFQEGLSQVADARARVRDAYLDPWTRYEPRDRLVRACELSQQLAALHLAANYRRWLPMICSLRFASRRSQAPAGRSRSSTGGPRTGRSSAWPASAPTAQRGLGS